MPRSGSQNSRSGGTRMMNVGQSRQDANSRMGRKGPRYCNRVISSQVTHVDSVYNKINPCSYTKKPLVISTWNVLSLVSDSSKLYQLSNNMTEYKLDLLGITETHMPGTGTMLLDSGALFIYSGRTDGIRRQGVGLALSKRVKNSLISYTTVSERILTARLHSRQINFSVTVAYAPTEDANDSVKDDFYQQLSDTLDQQPRQDVKLILGDFNAQVTSDCSLWPGIISKHSLHSTSNDNGTRLLDFCAMNQLTIGGTLFQHKDIHKGTWRSPNGKTVNQIDHICISTRWNHSLLDVRSYRGADIGSDHYLVRGYLQLKLQSVAKRKSSNHCLPALERLRDKSQVEEYNKALEEKLRAIKFEDMDVEHVWSNLRDTISNVSMEVLGVRPRKKREQHLSSDTVQLIKNRGEFKRKDPTSDANRSEYSRLNKLVKKSCKTDENNWAARVATDLESAAGRGQQREVWQKMKVLSNKHTSNKSVSVRDKTGKLISNPSSQKDRWAEYFKELLNPPPSNVDLSDLDSLVPSPSFPNLRDDDGPPSALEISIAIKRLKNYKSPGIDGISNEQLKYGFGAIKDQLLTLYEKVWNDEQIPEDWSKGVMVVMSKKGDASYCSNNRGITLRSTASKLFQIIFLQRLSTGLEYLLRENQCGFRPNRSCIDQLYSLRTIIHNCLEFNLPLYINFIDYKAAFDSINRDFIWKAFSHYGLPDKYIRVMKAFYNDTINAVRFNGDLTDWFNVGSGTGQGDIQGPPVFNVCVNLAAQLAEMYKSVSPGAVLQITPSEIQQPHDSVVDIDYADDQAAMDNTQAGLQETTDLFASFGSYAGLQINEQKTKVMAISKNASQRPFTRESTINITINGTNVEQVSEFKYLGAIICGDGSLDRELTARIQKASGAFNTLGNIWTSRSIQISTKIRIYKAAVITVLTYGCEVWNTTKVQMKRMETFHQRCLRRILRIRWFHRVRNEDVLQRAKTTDLESHISSMRLRWFGHVARMPETRLPNYLLEWTPNHGKRSRGRPKKSWLKVVNEDAAAFTGNNDISIGQSKDLARDRRSWREMINSKMRDNLNASQST